MLEGIVPSYNGKTWNRRWNKFYSYIN